MRNALAIVSAAALAATVSIVPSRAQVYERWPAIPGEVATLPPLGAVWAPYRCSQAPVYNFYHGAYYGGRAPAVYLEYAYRPYYRYAAYRVHSENVFLPRGLGTLCAQFSPHSLSYRVDAFLES